MSKIVVGKANGKNVGFELIDLVPTRLLIQANSGGGKSYLLRKIFEEAHGKIQTFVIDPAGEFSTLREKYGYVLVGEHGDAAIDIRSAGLLAEKLLELRASAVFDLYSLKPEFRHTWVKNFLAAMMNAPKKLWHPVLVGVDEAHKFMPEKGEGESEAKPEMLSLCSDGRKYGWCALLATQRLAKLDKSGASELLNVMIGPTFIDVDLERAHKALGIVKSEWAAFDEQMKTVAPGHFWALGRAISKKRILVTVGDVHTTHPKPGVAHTMEPPPPPEKVKALLPKLADLPQAAEAKARTEAEFKREIRELKTKLTAAERSAQRVAAAPAAAVVKADPGQARMLREMKVLLGDAMKIIAKINAIGFDGAEVKPEELQAALEKAAAEIGKVAAQKVAFKRRELENLKSEVNRLLQRLNTKLADDKLNIAVDVVKNEPVTVRPVTRTPLHVVHPRPQSAGESVNGISAPQVRILSRLVELMECTQQSSVSKEQLAAWSEMSPTSGGYKNYLGGLRSAGMIEYPQPGTVGITEAGRAIAQPGDVPATSDEMLARAKRVLGGGEARLLEILHATREQTSKQDLAEAAGFSPDSGGYKNYLGHMRTLGFIDYPSPGQVKCAEWLYLDAHEMRA